MKTARYRLAAIALALALLTACGGGDSPLLSGDNDASPAKREAIDAIGAHPGNKTQEKTARKEVTPAPKSPPLPAPPLAPVSVLPASTPVPPLPYKVQPGEVLPSIAAKQGVADAQKDAWINELLRLNAMLEAKVQSGQVLQLPPVPVYVPQPVLQPQLVLVPSVPPSTAAQPTAAAATPTRTPTPAPAAAAIPATATSTTAKATIVPPTATPTRAPATPTRTVAVATPTKTPVVIATPTTVKPTIVILSPTPTRQAQPTATKTP
jgi:LysM repeat protein